MPTPRAIVDGFGHVVLPAGSRVQTLFERQALLAPGHWVDESAPSAGPLGALAPIRSLDPARMHPFDAIGLLHQRLLHAYGPERPAANFPDIIWECALGLLAIGRDSPQAAMAAMALSIHPSNALLNCVGCALISGRLCADAGLGEEEARACAAAALSMNWPIWRLQDALGAEGRAPDELERLAITRHPQDAERALREVGVEDELWLSAVLSHHEEPSGNGYPSKLGAAEIPPLARALRFADRLWALLSSRPRRAGLPFAEALGRLGTEGGDFEARLAAGLAELFGRLPAGRFARLAHPRHGCDIFFSLGPAPDPAFTDGILIRAAIGSGPATMPFGFTPERLGPREIGPECAGLPAGLWPQGLWEALRLAHWRPRMDGGSR